MRYLCHTVYVVSASYPTIADASTVGREATPADIGVERLGCVSEGRVVSLSAAEVSILADRYSQKAVR